MTDLGDRCLGQGPVIPNSPLFWTEYGRAPPVLTFAPGVTAHAAPSRRHRRSITRRGRGARNSGEI